MPHEMFSVRSETESHEAPRTQALLLEGSPYQRGLAHGETLRESVQALVLVWKEALERDFQQEAEQVIRRFLAGTDFVSAMRKWTPDLLEEIEGIAQGAGLGFEVALGYQLLDEMWNNADAIVGEHCSSFGLPALRGDPACLAQTVDVERFRDGFQVVLHIRHQDSDLESLVLTCAGLVGFNGVNNRGIGVGVNTLLQLNAGRDGLPVAAVVRGLLERPTLEEASAFVRNVPHASGQSYLVGAAAGIHCFECSANAVVCIEPQGPEGVIWHTNHPLASTDCQPWFPAALDSGEEMPFLINSQTRYESLAHRLTGPLGASRLETATSVLSARDDARHPVCCAGGEGEFYRDVGLYTFASTIAFLSAEPEFHVAPGPADQRQFEKFGF